MQTIKNLLSCFIPLVISLAIFTPNSYAVENQTGDGYVIQNGVFKKTRKSIIFEGGLGLSSFNSEAIIASAKVRASDTEETIYNLKGGDVSGLNLKTNMKFNITNNLSFSIGLGLFVELESRKLDSGTDFYSNTTTISQGVRRTITANLAYDIKAKTSIFETPLSVDYYIPLANNFIELGLGASILGYSRSITKEYKNIPDDLKESHESARTLFNKSATTFTPMVKLAFGFSHDYKIEMQYFLSEFGDKKTGLAKGFNLTFYWIKS